MKCIAVINQKGGVGKSTTALAIGAGLFHKGYKVLNIDLDAQANLSFTLRAERNYKSAYDVIKHPDTIREAIQHTAQGDLLASSPALSYADTEITATGKEYRLKEALQLIINNYDYCIIDTPPALGILTINALTACHGAVIPAQADIFSLQGIEQLSGTIETVKRYCNKDLYIMGIVLTRYNSRSIISRETAEALNKTAQKLDTIVYNTKIRECTAIKEAQATRQDIYTYSPKSNATYDYTYLIDEILRSGTK